MFSLSVRECQRLSGSTADHLLDIRNVKGWEVWPPIIIVVVCNSFFSGKSAPLKKTKCRGRTDRSQILHSMHDPPPAFIVTAAQKFHLKNEIMMVSASRMYEIDIISSLQNWICISNASTMFGDQPVSEGKHAILFHICHWSFWNLLQDSFPSHTTSWLPFCLLILESSSIMQWAR